MHPSGNFLLSTSKDATIKVWDIREGHLMYTLQGHVGPVNAATFSADGRFWATGGSDQLVMVWKSNLTSGGRGAGACKPELEWSAAKDTPPPARASSPARPKSAPLLRGQGKRTDNLNASNASLHSSGVLKKVLLQQQKDAREALKSARAAETSSSPPRRQVGVAPPASSPKRTSMAAASPIGAAGSKIPVRTPSRSLSASSLEASEVGAALGKILGQLDLVTK